MAQNQTPNVRKLKVRDYAAQEGVSTRTVRRWIEKGAIQIDRVGPTKRVRVLVDSTR